MLGVRGVRRSPAGGVSAGVLWPSRLTRHQQVNGLQPRVGRATLSRSLLPDRRPHTNDARRPEHPLGGRANVPCRTRSAKRGGAPVPQESCFVQNGRWTRQVIACASSDRDGEADSRNGRACNVRRSKAPVAVHHWEGHLTLTTEDDERARSGAPPGFEFPLHSETILSDAELKAIGCLAIESASLEGFLELLVQSEASAIVADLLLDRKMFTAKLGILKKIFGGAIKEVELEHGKEGSLLRRFEDVCGKIASDISHRNTVVHGQWSRPEQPENFLLMEMSLKDLEGYFFGDRRNNAVAERKTGNPVKASEVMALAQRFRDYQISLSLLFLDYRKLRMASQGKVE